MRVEIQMECLLAYSPDLNPVKVVRRHIKKYIVNDTYPRVNDMTKAMHIMLQDGTVVPLSLQEYALHATKNATAA